eukprot:PhF_6_TR37153/c2_g1_i1/m.54691/K08900/BCS1; mitochondrial chaperone BCS1
MDFGNPELIIFGLMSSLKTGNVLLDIMLCLFLPNLFRRLQTYLQEGSQHFARFVEFKGREYNRYIVHKKSNADYWSSGNNGTDAKNQILQKALRLYMGRVLKLTFPSGDTQLSSVKESGSGNNNNKTETQAEQLKKFKVNSMPANDIFIELEPGLFFRNVTDTREEQNNRRKQSEEVRTVTEVKYHFKCIDRVNGKKVVDGFIRKAYDWYIQEMEKDMDVARYMYQPLVPASLFTEEKKKVYKRYKLSDDKSFDALFFPEKERLVRLIDNFMERKGKFQIPGFPYKLGLLLHGPPGTGKTSMVKAIAHRTKRHIISVPLSRIRTNQELMDVMFDQMYPYVGLEDGIKNVHKFNEVIFLMEDVDAAGQVIHARSNMKEKMLSTAMRQNTLVLGEKYLDDPTKLLKSLEEKKDPVSGKKKNWWDIPDKLDLAGLLNVLDGVVDCPGRILIMTTNHPEKIDPAVTRPGRINCQMYMGHMSSENAYEMICHYYGDVITPPEKVLLKKALSELFVRDPGYKWSPAEVEQMCAEAPTMDGLIEKINKC